MIESFEQARGLERHALLALVERGRPEQRVWAIWALALRMEDHALELGRHVEREPDAGVRRTLAVILAAHGETALLVGLARTDPDVAVRATAIQLVTRLAAAGAIDPAVVLEAGEREPAIRIAILGAIGANAPAFLEGIARRELDAREDEVRLEAFEALLRLGTRGARDVACGWMLRQPDVAAACDRWLRAASADSLAEAFADAPAATRAVVLERLRSPPWSAVERLIGDDSKQLRYALSRSDIAIPARVLARAILRGLHPDFVERLTSQLAATGHGRQLIAALRGALEVDDDGTLLRSLAERARRYAGALEVLDAADVLEELAALHPVEHLLGLENAVGQWLSERDAPADLVPLLPELHRYCTDHLARLGPAPSARRLPRELLALQDAGMSGLPTPWDERARFRELVATLDRLLHRGGG